MDNTTTPLCKALTGIHILAKKTFTRTEQMWWILLLPRESFYVFSAASPKISVWNSFTTCKYRPSYHLEVVHFFFIFPKWVHFTLGNCISLNLRVTLPLWEIHSPWGSACVRGSSFFPLCFTGGNPSSRVEGIHFRKKVKTFHQYYVSNIFLWYPKIHGPIPVSKEESLGRQHPRCMFSLVRKATFPYDFSAFWAKRTRKQHSPRDGLIILHQVQILFLLLWKVTI